MPRLTETDVHVPAVAAEVGLRYRNTDYIGTRVFPVASVTKLQNIVPRFGASVWFRDEAGPLTPGSRVPLSAPDADLTLQYACMGHGFGVPLSVAEQADYDLRVLALELATDKCLLARERRIAALVTDSTKWTGGTTLAGAAQWSAYETSTPIADLRTALAAVNAIAPGVRANTIVLGGPVWDSFRWHPEIDALVKASDLPPTERLRQFFEVDQFLVGHAQYTEDPEGTAEADVTYSSVWGRYAWVGHVNLRAAMADLLLPSAGYCIVQGGSIRTRLFERQAEGDEVAEAKEHADELVTSSACGYLISAAVAA